MSSRFEQVIKAAVLAGALTIAGCGGSGGGGDGNGNSDGSPSPQTLSVAETIDAQTLELTFTEAVVLKDASAAAAKFTLKQGFFGWNKNLNVNVETSTECLGGNLNKFYGLVCTSSTESGACVGESVLTTTSSTYACNTLMTYEDFNLISLTAFRRYLAGAKIGEVTDVQSVADDATKLRLIMSESLTDDDDGTNWIGSGRLRLTFTDGGRTITDQHGFRIAGFGPEAEDQGNVVFTHGNHPLVTEARAIDATTVELTFNEPLTTTDAATAAAHFNVTKWQLNEPVSANGYNTFYNSVYFDSGSPVEGAAVSLSDEGLHATLTLAEPINSAWDATYGLQLTYYAGADPAPSALRDADGNALEVYADLNYPGNLKKDYVD